MTEQKSEPRYTHECRDCTFLGQHGEYDLYFHKCGAFTQVYAKSEMRSHLLIVEELSMMNSALSIAKEKGLHTGGVDG